MTPGSLDCPFCGDAPRRPLGRCRDTYLLVPGEFDRWRCERCGLVFLAPRPSLAEMARYYPPHYWQPDGPGADAGVHRALRHLLARCPGGRVVDVGCGSGVRTVAIRTAGFAVMGLEPYAEAARLAREHHGLEVCEGALQACNLPPGSVDAVTMFDVLEHLEDPRGDLEAARRLLRPGGTLVVKVPNAGAWQSHLFGGRWFHADPPRHLQMFTPAVLVRSLATCGYSDCRAETVPDPVTAAFFFEQSVLMGLRARQWRSPSEVPDVGGDALLSTALEGKVYPGVPARGKRAFRWALRNLAYAPLAIENWCGGAVNLVGIARA